MCAIEETYAGAKAWLFFFLHSDRATTLSVSFSPSDFDMIVGAMKERFGAATNEETTTLTNRMGARFENHIVTWKRGDQKVEAKRYAGSVDRASVLFSSKAALEEFKERSIEEKKKRAGDL
jgi:hypothetical protein